MVRKDGNVEIKFHIGKHTYSLCFGHVTEWFEQIAFITLTEEWYCNHEVQGARLVFSI